MKITLNRHHYTIPNTWAEIKPKVLLKLAPLLFSFAYLESPSAFRYALLSCYIPAKRLAKLPEEYLNTLLELLSFTHTEKPILPVPTFKIRFTTYTINPTKLTLFQLAYAHFHLRYLNSPPSQGGVPEGRGGLQQALDEISATLLLPKNQKFTEAQKEKQQALFKTKLPLAHKLLIVLWLIQHHQATVIDRYGSNTTKPEPEENEEEDPSTTDQPPTNGPDYGYFPFILSLAHQGVYGTYEQVCDIPYETAFFNAHLYKTMTEK